MALADLDNDGDLDVVMNNLLEAPGIYRNEVTARRVAVRLRGVAPNTAGIGVVLLAKGGPVAQRTDVIAGGRYLSGDEALRTFATGTSGSLEVEVRWASGKRSVVSGIAPGTVVEVDEGLATSGPEAAGKSRAPKEWFEEVSSRLSHVHEDQPFDDFERQPLLPNRLSQLGPGVTWTDLNRDGLPDLVVGTGRGGRLGVFQNGGEGKFRRLEGGVLSKAAGRDTTSVLPVQGNLLVGSSHFEDGTTNGGYLRIVDPARWASGESVLGPRFAVGPLAAADVDADGAGEGTLEVFVGGRSVAGRYPEPADSLLLQSREGRLAVRQRFAGLGMVSGAVFTDVDGDGDPDLALAMEWGPVRLLENRKGEFVDATQAWGLGGLTGWWNGVAVGDFDGDGRLDLVASNWGLNSKYHASAEEPRVVYFGNFEGASTEGVDLVETWVDRRAGREWIEREYPTFARVFPWFRERMTTYAAFASAGLTEVFEKRLEGAGHLTVTTLASMVFLNRGGKFEAHALPSEAQWAPAFGVCVGDADGDGRDDVFLAQNFFATQPMSGRVDAGRGLWLRGDGAGGFEPLKDSGVTVYGEQRGAALADFDQDGRLDLVVTQNSAATALYRNVRARPGVRVVVRGEGANPDGFGTWVRAVAGGKMGPLKEIHNGSGYWSCDSPETVLTSPEGTRIEKIWVRFPGKAPREVPVPENATVVTLTP
jgi:hypothetical protein